MVRATADLSSLVPPHLISTKVWIQRAPALSPKEAVKKHVVAPALEEQMSTRDPFFY